MIDGISMKFLLYYCTLFSLMTPPVMAMSDFPQSMDVFKLVVGMLFVSLSKGVYTVYETSVISGKPLVVSLGSRCELCLQWKSFSPSSPKK